MMVAQVKDTAGDDAPNTSNYVHSGWRQSNGAFASGAAQVSPTNTGSTAVGFDFVTAAAANGYNSLKMCFVKNGVEVQCRSNRSAANELLTLTSRASVSYLNAYDNTPLLYTFGRLAGVPGQSNSYNQLSYESSCISRAAGGYFGQFTEGMCEHDGLHGCPSCRGVWHGVGMGCSYQPDSTDASELSACDADGFNLYIGRYVQP
jgi:hypothetical protein